MRPDEELAVEFATTHPEDAARLLERAGPEEAAGFLAGVPPATAARVVRVMAPAGLAACGAVLPETTLSAIIAELPLDEAAAALRRFDPDRRDAVLARLPAGAGESLRGLLSYGPHTAGAMADPLVLALLDDLDVAEAQRQLRGFGRHPLFDLYVITRQGTLVGVLDLPELMRARPDEALADVIRRDPVRLDVHADFATVAAHHAWRDYDALPVVDAGGKLVGAIRHQSVRRLEAELRLRDRGESVVATLVGLSELYWAGLSGMLVQASAPGGAATGTPPSETPNVE